MFIFSQLIILLHDESISSLIIRDIIVPVIEYRADLIIVIIVMIVPRHDRVTACAYALLGAPCMSMRPRRDPHALRPYISLMITNLSE